MKSDLEIKIRIDELRDKMNMLKAKKNEEQKRSFESREHNLLLFLSGEYKVYEFGLAQLEWLFSE